MHRKWSSFPQHLCEKTWRKTVHCHKWLQWPHYRFSCIKSQASLSLLQKGLYFRYLQFISLWLCKPLSNGFGHGLTLPDDVFLGLTRKTIWQLLGNHTMTTGWGRRGGCTKGLGVWQKGRKKPECDFDNPESAKWSRHPWRELCESLFWRVWHRWRRCGSEKQPSLLLEERWKKWAPELQAPPSVEAYWSSRHRGLLGCQKEVLFWLDSWKKNITSLKAPEATVQKEGGKHLKSELHSDFSILKRGSSDET